MKTFSPPRLSLGIAILMLTIGAQSEAKATTIYDINLTPSSGNLIGGTGAFSWDGSTFTDFTVTWGTETWDFTADANSQTVTEHGCDGNALLTFFQYLTNADCENGYNGYSWKAEGQGALSTEQVFYFSPNYNYVDVFGATGTLNDTGTDETEGTLTVTAVGAPEPTSFFFMSSGLLAVALLARNGYYQVNRPSPPLLR